MEEMESTESGEVGEGKEELSMEKGGKSGSGLEAKGGKLANFGVGQDSARCEGSGVVDVFLFAE